MSDSESDEDFVPGEPEQVSEEDSANEETDLQFEKELEHKANKRKATEKNTVKKRRRTRNNAHEVDEKDEQKEKHDQEDDLDPLEQKKRDDDLWAMFLEGTDTKPKPKTEINQNSAASKSSIISDTQKNDKAKAKTENDSKEREKRIFEFAGETIIVENNTIKERIKSTDLPTIANTLGGPSSLPTKPAGLSSVLGQINKKNKLSTLEVSKLDWETYKQKEGIEEEVKTFNKGKDGYLERQDFLQRADLRQFEIERELRMKRRSNR